MEGRIFKNNIFHNLTKNALFVQTALVVVFLFLGFAKKHIKFILEKKKKAQINQDLSVFLQTHQKTSNAKKSQQQCW